MRSWILHGRFEVVERLDLGADMVTARDLRPSGMQALTAPRAEAERILAGVVREERRATIPHPLDAAIERAEVDYRMLDSQAGIYENRAAVAAMDSLNRSIGEMRGVRRADQDRALDALDRAKRAAA